MIIVKQPVCDVEKITRVLRKTIPDVEIDQNVGAELSYSLPDGMSQLFPTLFEELENKQQELGIASYGCRYLCRSENPISWILFDGSENIYMNSFCWFWCVQ